MIANANRSKVVRALFSSIARRYDLANHLLSWGLDLYWRRRAASIVRGWNPGNILDLATGSGDLALTLRATCPQSVTVGADFCHPMLLEASRKGVPNLVGADGMRLPFHDGSFEAVTIAFGLRNMESWPSALAEMARVLRPGCHLLVLDFAVPPQPLRSLYRLYLHHVLPRMAGLLTGEKAAYHYLGQSIEEFPCGPAMCALIARAGFADAAAEPLSGGIVSIYTATRAT